MEKVKKPVNKPQKTLIVFILDKSGSMSSCEAATISGFNEYIGSLRKDTNAEYSLSLTLFDTVLTELYENTPLSQVKDLDRETYKPDGSTALYDAACQTIADTVKTVKDQKVLCVIMTDGEENSSKEYTEKELSSKIKEMEGKGNWSFVFLGANQDSYAKAVKYGISHMNTSNYNSTNMGTRTAFSNLAGSTQAFAASAGSNTSAFFSQQQQQDLQSHNLLFTKRLCRSPWRKAFLGFSLT